MTSMTIGSSTKKKPAHGKKSGPHQLVAEWTIEQASTPHHVSVSFTVRSESADATARSTTRRFLLPSDSAAELIDELKEVLEDSAAIESLGSDASALDASEVSGGYIRQNEADDVDPMSNHFALGAYGLVGN
jgi:hypothetical protein